MDVQVLTLHSVSIQGQIPKVLKASLVLRNWFSGIRFLTLFFLLMMKIPNIFIIQCHSLLLGSSCLGVLIAGSYVWFIVRVLTVQIKLCLKSFLQAHIQQTTYQPLSHSWLSCIWVWFQALYNIWLLRTQWVWHLSSQ
jgi:hypothetical protein